MNYMIEINLFTFYFYNKKPQFLCLRALRATFFKNETKSKK